jgi:hypothetical protein
MTETSLRSHEKQKRQLFSSPTLSPLNNDENKFFRAFFLVSKASGEAFVLFFMSITKAGKIIFDGKIAQAEFPSIVFHFSKLIVL